MERLQVQLLVGLYRNAPRRWAFYCFRNCLRIPEIVLVTLPERSRIGRRHLLDLVTKRDQLTSSRAMWCEAMPASRPTRQRGTFTNRAAIRVRDTFSRSTSAPLSSKPITCSVFLPVSIPMVSAIVVSALLGMACPPRFPPPTPIAVRGRSTAGPSHSRPSTERLGIRALAAHRESGTHPTANLRYSYRE